MRTRHALAIVTFTLIGTATSIVAAQTDPPPLRAGGPKAWEDYGMWKPGGDWAVSPSGNCQQRIKLFAWAPPGVGARIVVTLFYNSAEATTQFGQGFGVRLGVAAKLTVGADGTVTVEEPDGTPRRFPPRHRAGRYHAEPGDTDILIQSGTQYVLSSKPGYQRVFENSDGNGFLERARRDRTGDTVTFTYDATGLLQSVTDSAGRQSTFTRTNGLLTQIADPEGRVFTLTYDQGMLTAVTGPVVGSAAPSTQLAYDPASHLIISRRSWGGAFATVFGYASDGRLNKIGFPDQVANRIDYSAGEVAITDALRRTTVLKFSNGAVVEAIAKNGLRTEIARDASNRPIQIIDGLGRVTSYSYDNNNNVIATRDPLGRTTTFSYGHRHDLLSTTTPLGQTSSYLYNSFDELKQVTSPIGEVTKLHYDGTGNLLRIVDFAGKTRLKATYDVHGQPLTVTGRDHQSTSYTYDQLANLVSATLPGNIQMSQTTSPLGRTLTYTNPLAEQSTYGYDALGRIAQLNLAGGRSITPTLDLDGRLVGMDVRFGAQPQTSVATLTATNSIATWQLNNVSVQTAPAALAATPDPPAYACMPSCAGRCGQQISDTCGGTTDCACASGLTCSAMGLCLRGQP